jgi:hypothetical protein
MSSTVYSTPGTYTFTLPANIDVNTPLTVDLKGPGGGAGDKASNGTRAAGGAGGRVTGTVDISAMTPGVSTITVVVGGKGATTPNTYTGSESTIAGGYNGGGSVAIDYGGNGGGGGGATDIRIGGTGLANRKAVAAGGGGSGASSNTTTVGGVGGAGGAATGATGGKNGTTGGSGGVGGGAAAGGAGGAGTGGSSAGSAGTSGNGGAGAMATGGLSGYAASGGGGGGGYFGGGGGGGSFSASVNTTNGGGGGGGSNYVAGLLASTVNTQGGGSAAATDGSATLTYNVVPNQPTLTAHANGDDTAGVAVTWAFSDPDPGDTQSKANVRWRVGAGAWTTITNAVVGAGTTYTFAANTFQTAGVIGQSVEWQVQTYDAANALGPWSASSFVVPRREPTTTPTITLPTPFNSRTPAVTVANTTQFRYARVTVLDVTAGTTTDFGWTDFTTEQTTITYALPFFNYVNGQSYTFKAYTADYIDVPVSSPVSANNTVTSAVDAPLQPTLTATADPTTASVLIAVTNPGSDPSPAVRNEVYRTDLGHNGVEARIASNVTPGGTFTDWQPPTNTSVRYRVAAVSAAGNRTYSA